MSKNFDVFIGGDGIVGRTLALQLAQARLRVALVARKPRLPVVPDVRAYALNVASRQQLLARCDIERVGAHIGHDRQARFACHQGHAQPGLRQLKRQGAANNAIAANKNVKIFTHRSF
jgi:2-polyprenyl-6-methoxyphenol hydroxylase-like FAD-dependent oxidoreductase